VPTDVLKEKAISRGLSENQIVEYGLPIRKGFWRTDSSSTTQKEAGENHFWDIFKGGKKEEQASVSKDPNKASLRAQLGLDEDLPTVLIVGGGDGMGGIVDIASAIGQKLGSSSAKPAYQMVVVCGSNKDAQSKLSIKEWGPGVRASIQGFVNNMDEWMNASDALVTKAGPGTIAEASICGLPCMLFAYL
jgi:1,2-diacylglycerol 3-beta-galactosyltransferase